MKTRKGRRIKPFLPQAEVANTLHSLTSKRQAALIHIRKSPKETCSQHLHVQVENGGGTKLCTNSSQLCFIFACRVIGPVVASGGSPADTEELLPALSTDGRDEHRLRALRTLRNAARHSACAHHPVRSSLLHQRPARFVLCESGPVGKGSHRWLLREVDSTTVGRRRCSACRTKSISSDSSHLANL